MSSSFGSFHALNSKTHFDPYISNSVSNHPHVNPFCKLSDMVPINSLASRLEGQFDRWMVRWLDGLIQRLRVSASMPKQKSVTSGVPQRPMLG